MPPRSSTPDAIRAAAVALFSERGYEGASVRDIAGAAGVDAALVIRHFGSKELLFVETMRDVLGDPVGASGPLDGFGERFVRFLVATPDPTRGIFIALVRASGSARIRAELLEVHVRGFAEPLEALISGPDAEVRARLVASVIGGMLYALWIVEDPVLSALSDDDLVTRFGGIVQELLTG